jgi:hypothetical protein
MKPQHDRHLDCGLLTRRSAISISVPVLFLASSAHAGRVEIGDQPAENDVGWRKLYTEVEQVFIERVILPACGMPHKTGDESNRAYCRWLIGRQPQGENERLRLVYDLATFSEQHTKDAQVGLFNTTRVADPRHRLFESCTSMARVGSLEPNPRAILTAAVEEITVTNGKDAAAIHYVTKRFLFIDHTWNLVESHVSRIG